MKKLSPLLFAAFAVAVARAADPNTLILAFQPQENPTKLQLNAEAFAQFLGDEVKRPTKVFLPTDYSVVVEALRAGHAHVAYFSAWPYVKARELAGVELLLAEVRADGRTAYVSRWYTRDDTGIRTLADARGKRAAFTSPTSTSGYLFPYAKLIDEGLLPERGDPKNFFREVLFAGGYEQSLKALVNGQVDLAAASDYALPRYLNEEERKNIVILSEQGPVPSHCIAVKSSLSPALKTQIKAAFLKLNAPEHKDLLKTLYGAERLAEVTHQAHVGPLAHALKITGLETDLKPIK